MSRIAPKTAPTTAPTTAPKKGELEWRDHWHEYAEPRISLIRGKWHWCVTKPKSLQKPTDKDKRLSAKTTDKAVAVERKWAVVAKIYQSFDDEFQAQIEAEKNLSPMERHLEFCNLASYLWAEQCLADRAEGLDFHECFEALFGETDLPDMYNALTMLDCFNVQYDESLLRWLDEDTHYLKRIMPKSLKLTPDEQAFMQRSGIQPLTQEQYESEVAKLSDPKAFSNPDTLSQVMRGFYTRLDVRAYLSSIGADDTLSRYSDKHKIKNVSAHNMSSLLPAYMEEKTWKRITTKNASKRSIEQFINLVGDLDIHEVTAKHAYALAQALAKQGKANRTVKAAVSYVKGLFTWAITNPDLDRFNANPFTDLDLTRFGYETESYKPFTDVQLEELFALAPQKMNQREHLVLSLLIATGCRLDEICLLSWDNIVTHEEGWRYIDLTSGLVKNVGSRRLVPIPKKVDAVMPPVGTKLTPKGLVASDDGRLFDYALDEDGKAQRAASQAVGRQLKKIKAERLQVTHSLRGNLKDMLRDAGVSKELNDFLTGHSQGDVAGNSYGKGHSIEQRYAALCLPEHRYIKPYK